MNPPVDSTKVERLLGVVFLLGIVLQTAVGVVIGSLLDNPTLEGGSATTLVGVLLFAGVANVVISRLFILPMQVKTNAPLAAVTSLGYTFADAPAVYGMVAAILVGEGLVALPFGLIALTGWLVVHQFLAGIGAPQAEDFTTL